MSEPSVLTYARFFDLTQDHTIHDPQTVLIVIPVHSKDPSNLQNLNENVENLIKDFERAARDYVSLANDDPLPISQDVANYLKSCTSSTIHDMSRIYDELLPDPYRIRKLKLDLPLLVLGNGNVEGDVSKIRKGVDFKVVIDDFADDNDDERDQSRKYEPLESSAVSAEILEWSKTQLEAAMKKEKLDVSLETIKYIQEVLSISIKPADILRTILALTTKSTGPDSPDVCSITKDDFQLETKTVVSDLSDNLELEKCDDDELPPPMKQW